MKTSTYKQFLGATILSSVALMVGCGPIYTEDRWYARDYYSQGGAPGYAQPQRPVQAQTVDVGVAPDPHFADLTPYGQWETTGEYGRIWVPYANRTPGWRPYFYGQWQYTDYGWSWVSDEAWGAGPYHYGRWTWMNGRNWVWIPDYTWGPAWVSWSHGGGCVGWAPMGPGGASWGDIHGHSTYWTYVPTAQFGGGKVQHVVVSASEVPRIHQQTVIVDNSSNIRGNNGQAVAYNAGPGRDQVQQWTARPVDTRPIAQVPSVQPRRIPDNVTPPAGGTYGTATQPPATRPGVTTPVVTPVNPTYPTRPGVTNPPTTPDPYVPNPTRPGVGTPVNPTNPTYPTRPGVGTPVNPTDPTYPTRPGVGTPVNPTYPTVPTRPGVGTPVNPTYPMRPDVGTPTVDPPTRPGTNTVDPPTRPGAGYTGAGPNIPGAQTTVPRPSPPPVENGNYAPAPNRYTPPTYTPPTRAATPTYQAPTYQAPTYQAPTYQAPSRAATPTYQPTQTYQPPTRAGTPTYNPAPVYQPQRAAPSYSPPSYQPSSAPRFSPPPASAPSATRPATSSAPAPTRRR